MRAVDYGRVSTDEQAREGFSIESQEEKNANFISSQGWKHVDHYVDDGYSAKNLKRPAMQRLIDDVSKDKFDVVVFYKLDRLVRSVSDLDQLLKLFDSHNVAIRSVTEPFDTTTAIGRFLITLVAAIAQWERETISERVSVNMEQKVKKGLWPGGTPPYGYTNKEEKLVINPDEAPLVKKVFELARMFGLTTIAKKLNQSGMYQTRNQGDWHVDTIRGIVNNPVYAGYLTFNKDPKDYRKPAKEKKLYDAVHPRIIPREEFWELQRILDGRRVPGGKRETSNYYFSSILKCARCGHSMSGHKGSNGTKTYRCSGKKSGKTCTSHIIKEDNLVKTVLSQLNKIFSIEGKTEVTDISANKINELEQELKSIQRLLDKQKAMFKADVISIDELIEETEPLRENEKQIISEIKKYKQSGPSKTEEALYISENIYTLWDFATDQERKQMINTLFTQIIIDTKDEYQRGTTDSREIIIVSAK